MKRSTWRLDALFVTLIAVLAFNLAYFNGCRCWYGSWTRMQGDAALIILGLIVVRFIAAWIFAEKNNGWVIYVYMLLLSPILVTAAFAIAFQFLPKELQLHSH
jgi:hypothetical protein